MSNFDAFADFRMDGYSAIVTGGAQNIGEAFARTLSGAGAKVLMGAGHLL
jgi:7-alpha-hydroxysteroid dehydrogenase